MQEIFLYAVAVLFALLVGLMVASFIRFDVKHIRRYKKATVIDGYIVEYKGTVKTANYGLKQASTVYHNYEVSYTILQAPGQIFVGEYLSKEKDLQKADKVELHIELSEYAPGKYRGTVLNKDINNRFSRFMICAVIGFIWGAVCIWMKQTGRL